MYDPRFTVDGLSPPLVIPPAVVMADINNETYTVEGVVSYRNQYVAVTQMGGQGSLKDHGLGIGPV